MKFSHHSLSLGALLLAAASANSAVTFTFLDPPGGHELAYVAPGEGGTFGTLTAAATVNLQVDLTEHGLGVVLFGGLHYTKQAKVSDAVAGPGGSVSAEVYAGEFAFVDGGGFVVFTGTFGNPVLNGADGANLHVNGLSGGLTSSADLIGGSLTFAFGSAQIPAGNPGAGLSLPDYLNANSLAFGDAIDAVWTISGVSPSPRLVNEGGLDYLDSFTSNDAFTGTVSVVPTPGAAGLAFVAFVAAAPRRKR